MKRLRGISPRLGVVLIGGLATAGLTATIPWQGQRFAVFCGIPRGYQHAYYADGEDPDSPQACICGGDPRETGLLARMMGPDKPEGACLTAERRDEMEKWATEGYSGIMSFGFGSPSSDLLGPVLSDPAGQPAVRLYGDYTAPFNYAATHAPCSGGAWADELASVRFKPGQFGRLSPNAGDTFSDPLVYRMLVHELVHVVQYAQPFITSPANDCPEPLWVLESAADAVSGELMHRQFPSYKPSLSVKSSRSVYGLRPYNRAFTWVDSDAPPVEMDRYGNAIVPEYTLSSFWTYLAQRFSDGGFGYLAQIYDAPGGGSDWLAWLDRRLRAVVGHPLYVLYPDFIANYAQWGQKRYTDNPNLNQGIWLRESFPGDGGPCEEIELSRENPKDNFQLSFEPISARCVRVKVGGLLAGERARVKFMADREVVENLDELHLSLAYSTATAVEAGRAYSCYDETTTASSGRPCLVKKHIGEMKGPSSGLYAATWEGDEFRADSEAHDMEMLYLLSVVPLHPTDDEHDWGHSREVYYRGAFSSALETTTLAAAGGDPKPASATVNRVPQSGTVPMTGVDAGPQGLVVQALMAPQMAFPGIEIPAGAPIGDGIRSLTLSDGEAGAALPGVLAGSGLQIQLQFLQRPLTFGSTGSYRAYVMGMDGSAGGGSNPLANLPVDIPGGLPMPGSPIINVPVDDEAGSAVVEVVEFSDDLLHLRVRGTYCRQSNLDLQSGDCRAPETFQAEITRAFGWTYDNNQSFVGIDTPGMAEYRAYLPYPTADAMAGLPNLPSPPRGAGGGGSGAAAGGGVDVPATDAAGTLTIGGVTYRVTTNLCDVPDRIPAVVLSGEAQGPDGVQNLLTVTQAQRPGGGLEEQIALTTRGGPYAASYRRGAGGWERLTPTEASNPSSPLDRGQPKWVPAEGALLTIDGSTLRASALFYGPDTGIQGQEGQLVVTCR